MLKYKVIKTKTQYRDYCRKLEGLVFSQSKLKRVTDEIELLTLLIDKWDSEHSTQPELDPVALIQTLMTDHGLKPKDMVPILGISKGYVSDILNYKKGLSKEIIRRLSAHFKMTQEAFNRPYKLVTRKNLNLKKSEKLRSKGLTTSRKFDRV